MVQCNWRDDMKNDLTDVYAILRKEFGEELRHFGLDNSKELASFLHYNAHNEMFVNTDESVTPLSISHSICTNLLVSTSFSLSNAAISVFLI